MSDPTPANDGQPVVVSERIRRVLRVAHYALKTEKAYTQWWERFQAFSGERPESELGPDEVRAFLENLAVERQVSASTQKQALNALVFVFGQVLGRPLGNLGDMVQAKPKRRLPCVLTVEEVDRVLAELNGVPALYLTRPEVRRSCTSPECGRDAQKAHVLAKRGYIQRSHSWPCEV